MPATRYSLKTSGLGTKSSRRTGAGQATAQQKAALRDSSKPFLDVSGEEEAVDLSICDIEFPLENTPERAAFRTKDNKEVTKHAWNVYDFVRKIPRGKVTTYKLICEALGEGSPRSVGSALRNNPFAPFVPCHRIIASNHFIGGFCGEWGPDSKTGTKFNDKMSMLAQEGVGFTKDGYLVGREEKLWAGP